MKSLVVVRFASSGKTYDYFAEGSSNELAGAVACIVETPYGTSLAYVDEIRPLSEQVFNGTLKPISKLLYERSVM